MTSGEHDRAMSLPRPVLPLVPLLCALVLTAGCAKHADYVNLRQEIRATIRAQMQAQEKAREQHEAMGARLQTLEVALESDEIGRQLRGLALRLQSVEERLATLEAARSYSSGLPPSSPIETDAPPLDLPVPAPPAPETARLPDLSGVTPAAAFNEAYKDYLSGRYDLAVSTFQRFLEDFPTASLAPNAHYWLGESYYSKRDFVRAMQSFERVVNEYPGNDKVPSALFKIGLAAMEIGDTNKARRYLKRVIEDYSASNEAKLAKNKLADIR